MICKRNILVLGLMIGLSLMTSAFASNGSQIGTVGARGTAMGSCFRGLADDWSAVFFNPAGLTQLGRTTLGISSGLIIPRGDYTAYPYPAEHFPFSGMYTDTREASPRNFLVPALGFFYKPSERFVMGLGVYAPFGLGAEWDLVTLPDNWGNATGISKEKDNYSDHQVINVQPTVAFALSDRISVGLGASYIWGKMTIDMVKFALNPAIPKWGMLQQGLAIIGITLPNLTADQYRIPAEVNMDGSGSAYGFNAGLLFKLSDKFQFGISARYASDLKMTGTLKKTLLMSGDAAKATIINNLSPTLFASAEDPTGAATKQQIAALFSGQNIVVEDYDVKASLPLPMTVGAGVAFKPSDRLTLTADVSWTNWETWDVITVEPQEEGFENTNLNENWTNTIEAGLGFELLVRQRETRQCFLRGGFYTVASPVPDETLNPTIIDPNRRYVATLGYGIDFGKISVNLAGEIVLFGEKEVPASAYAFDADGVQDNYAGVYNFRAYVIRSVPSVPWSVASGPSPGA